MNGQYPTWRKSRRFLAYLAALLYVVAGTMHFLSPAPFVRIVPRWIPWPELAVSISGAAEILGGLGLTVPRVRRLAAWGLVALLVAVFPANVYMATNPVEAGAAGINPLYLWFRLPVQGLLIWWLLWCSKA